MNKYLIMPENAKWFEIYANTHEMAFRGICFWYSYGRRIAVMDTDTAEIKMYLVNKE